MSYFFSAFRTSIIATFLGLVILPSIADAAENFSRDVECQAEALQFYFAVIDLQNGVTKEASVGPKFVSLSIIRGAEAAAELESRYGEVKDMVWESPHFRTMDKAKTGILIYDECLEMGAAAPASEKEVGGIKDFFNGKFLGVNRQYFESVLGVPRESYGDQHEFRIQGCDITATITGDKVSALHMALTDKCSPDLTTFIGSYAPPPTRPLTAGSFVEASGGGTLRYSADCLSLCGNAYTPSVYARWDGPRAIDFMEVVLDVALINDDALRAAEVWQERMTRIANETYVSEGRFNCDNRFDPIANEAFKNIRVTGITIGHNLKTPSC